MYEVLINHIVSLIFAVVGFAAVYFFNKWIGNNSKWVAAMGLDDFFQESLAYGEKKAKTFLSNEASEIEIDSKIIEKAVEYVVRNAPDWLKEVGYAEEGVKEKIEALLEEKKEKKNNA